MLGNGGLSTVYPVSDMERNMRIDLRHTPKDDYKSNWKSR